MFYCRNSAEIKVYGSLQTSSRFDSIVLRNRQQKHTAIRYGQIKKSLLWQFGAKLKNVST